MQYTWKMSVEEYESLLQMMRKAYSISSLEDAGGFAHFLSKWIEEKNRVDDEERRKNESLEELVKKRETKG